MIVFCIEHLKSCYPNPKYTPVPELSVIKIRGAGSHSDDENLRIANQRLPRGRGGAAAADARVNVASADTPPVPLSGSRQGCLSSAAMERSR